MSESPDRIIRWKQRVARGAEWLFSLVIVATAVGGILTALDIVNTTLDPINVVTLAFVVALGYITTIRPALRKPELKLIPEKTPPWSPMTDGSTGGSWTLRLIVLNRGLTPARNCIGRLTEIYDDKGTRLRKFDPLTLYWQRQDGAHVKFEPVDIQGYGDFGLLDIAKVEKGDNIPIKLRVVLNLDLVSYPENYPSPGNKPNLQEGSYYIRVGVHGDDLDVEPLWFEISCSQAESHHGWESAPCQIRQKNPPWAIR